MDQHKRTEGARTKAATKGQIGDSENQKIGGDWKFQKNPAFLKERLAIWTGLYDKQKEVYKCRCFDSNFYSLPQATNQNHHA